MPKAHSKHVYRWDKTLMSNTPVTPADVARIVQELTKSARRLRTVVGHDLGGQTHATPTPRVAGEAWQAWANANRLLPEVPQLVWVAVWAAAIESPASQRAGESGEDILRATLLALWPHADTNRAVKDQAAAMIEMIIFGYFRA